MKPCIQRVASNPDGAKTCVKCGLPLPMPAPEPVDKVSTDEFLINERDLSARVRNTGTASMAMTKVFREGIPTPILGISARIGTLEGESVTVQPGTLTSMPLTSTDKASFLLRPFDIS